MLVVRVRVIEPIKLAVLKIRCLLKHNGRVPRNHYQSQAGITRITRIINPGEFEPHFARGDKRDAVNRF